MELLVFCTKMSTTNYVVPLNYVCSNVVPRFLFPPSLLAFIGYSVCGIVFCLWHQMGPLQVGVLLIQTGTVWLLVVAPMVDVAAAVV